MGERQEIVDAFYFASGPCCAGCDWWRHFNSGFGECTRSAPAPAKERFSMIDIESSSLSPGAGHVVTHRGHVCGEFRDSFDWQTLPPHYLRRVGFRHVPTGEAP